MKKIVTIALSMAILSLPALALEVNQPMPEAAKISMVNVVGADIAKLSDNQTSIAANKGEKGTLVFFSCNTCPYVLRWKERMNEQIAAFKKKGFGVIVVNSNARQHDKGDADSPVEMQKFASASGYTVPYVIDRNNVVADAFGAERTPEVFLFDKNNKLVYHGAIDDDPNPKKAKVTHLKNAMVALLADKMPSPATTKSVGCSIKRIKKKDKKAPTSSKK